MRSHALGPNPIDPNLIAQGVPPDSRMDPSDNLYGPVAGTPLPPSQGAPDSSAEPPGAAPVPSAESVPAPQPEPMPAQSPTPTPDGAPTAAPSAFSGANSNAGPIAVAHYSRQTGEYMGPDGHMYRQTDLVSAALQPKSWTDLVMGAT
jgi:phospholipid/cholesterol/gamma-HCH transport system substrate-binding protein